MAEKDILVEVISGVEGPCLSINNLRVAGPKPWGGGKITHTWKTDPGRVREALTRENPKEADDDE